MKQILTLSTPKSVGDVDVRRVQLDQMHFYDDHVMVMVHPNMVGPIRIYKDGEGEPGPTVISLGPVATAKLENFISAIEDAIKTKLETP